MQDIQLLQTISILIGSAVLVVVAFKRLSLSPVLGYLVAGAIIGDYGLKIATCQQTSFIARFGVVFLLFAIGLELSFERIKAMRKYVFGLGSLQIILTSCTISLLLSMTGMDLRAAIVIGIGLSLSSTAVVMQIIRESNNQSTQLGRITLSVLLQQDFAVVPLLVLVPILAQNNSNVSILPAIGVPLAKGLVALCIIFVVGRLFLRPVFKIISSGSQTSNNELFISATLLIVLSAAWITEYCGLSEALGAFMAGILVAETEFRTQAEESIEPFKGMLLGLFFMSVGMTVDVAYLQSQIGKILLLSLALIVVKSLILTALCMLFKLPKGVSIQAGLVLSQGSEFAFILCTLAMKSGLISAELERMLLVIVTSTMAITPLLSLIGNKIANYFSKEEYSPADIIKSGTVDLSNHVVVLGLNQTTQMAVAMLAMHDLPYVAIDNNEQVVKLAQQKGIPAFQGDFSDPNILNASGVERAGVLLLAISNLFSIKKVLSFISKDHSELPVFAYAPNLANAAKLYESGTTRVVPGAQEAGLQLAAMVLKNRGVSDIEISRLKNIYRDTGYKLLKQTV